MLGLSLALEPLFGRAIGAKDFKSMGAWLQRSLIILLLADVPISVLWLNAEAILLACAQPKEIAAIAGLFLRYQLPQNSLMAIVMPLRLFARSQGHTTPIAMGASRGFLLQIPLNYLFMDYIRLGVVGPAIAGYCFEIVHIVFLVSHGAYNQTFAPCWPGWSPRVWAVGWGTFLRLGVPCCAALWLQVWSFETLVLMGGWLPNPAYNIAALAIAFYINAVLSGITFGVATASSTRIAMALGANKPQIAALASRAFLLVGLGLGAVIALALAAFRNPLIGLLTSEPEMVRRASKILLVLALYAVLDSPQQVAQGILQGSARPHVVFLIVLITQYPIGIVASFVLGFKERPGVSGLWMGMVIADVAQLGAEVTLVWLTNWEIQAANTGTQLARSLEIVYAGENISYASVAMKQTYKP
ncbi:MATE efflux family protein [Klebsormidium nitens]|uniref:MATE efflux family protein n=1 Tax=Klebsormidium nitens TaxID=105231 RepID=A0A1Y1IJA4_KLENI|nr:MATE efflux family protein [Klebsormidium nitens]|eukprot:GAQ90783.1 MATE efflux family protein [Klebsormidium nitens]